MPLTVPPVTRAPAVFSTGIDSPVSMDSSTELAPSVTKPSTGNFLAGTNSKAVSDVNFCQRDVALVAVFDKPRSFGRQDPGEI